MPSSASPLPFSSSSSKKSSSSLRNSRDSRHSIVRDSSWERRNNSQIYTKRENSSSNHDVRRSTSKIVHYKHRHTDSELSDLDLSIDEELERKYCYQTLLSTNLRWKRETGPLTGLRTTNLSVTGRSLFWHYPLHYREHAILSLKLVLMFNINYIKFQQFIHNYQYISTRKINSK